MEERNRWEKRIKLIRRAIFLLIYLVLAFNTIATDRLNKKYWSVVAWDSELRRYCEYNGNEYLVTGKCNFFVSGISAGAELYHVYYDEQHPDVTITLDIRENKFGKIRYWLGIGDDIFGEGAIVDKNLNPISWHGQEPNEKIVPMMNKLHKEVKRVTEIANEKWNLEINYEYHEVLDPK